MTNLEVFKTIRAMGLAVSYNDGEWQINYKKEDKRYTPDSKYFTDDKLDAIQTAKVMSEKTMTEPSKTGDEVLDAVIEHRRLTINALNKAINKAINGEYLDPLDALQGFRRIFLDIE